MDLRSGSSDEPPRHHNPLPPRLPVPELQSRGSGREAQALRPGHEHGGSSAALPAAEMAVHLPAVWPRLRPPLAVRRVSQVPAQGARLRCGVAGEEGELSTPDPTLLERLTDVNEMAREAQRALGMGDKARAQKILAQIVRDTGGRPSEWRAE